MIKKLGCQFCNFEMYPIIPNNNIPKKFAIQTGYFAETSVVLFLALKDLVLELAHDLVAGLLDHANSFQAL